MTINGIGRPSFAPSTPGHERLRSIDNVFSTALGSGAVGVDNAGAPVRANFADMSRGELFDWMNVRMKSGELSLDDSSGLLRLAGKGTIDQHSTETGDATRVDFFRMAHDNISAALVRKDDSTVAQMRSALAILQRFQA